MKFPSRMNLYFLLSCFIILLIIPGKNIFPADNEILYLNLDHFKDFFNDYKSYEKFYKDWEVTDWVCGVVFWERRKILIPNIPENKISKECSLSLGKHYAKVHHEMSHLYKNKRIITKNQMMAISLEYLKKNSHLYSCISCIKKKCIYPEEKIKFYVVELCSHLSPKKLKISYLPDGIQSSLCPLEETLSESEPETIKVWEKILGRREFDIPKITCKLELFICKGIPKDTFKHSEKIFFCDEREKLITESIILIKDKKESVFKIEVEIEKNKSFFNKMMTEGVWLNNNKDRITNTSLYSNIKISFKNGSSNPFKLYFARTRSFTEGKFYLDERNDPKMEQNEKDIKAEDLQGILSYIKKVKKNRFKSTLLYLTGYADKEGKKKKDWKENNDRLAEGRAEAVKRWLVEKLGDLIDKEDIITEGCDDWHYKFSNRFVEVRIY